MLDKHNHKRNNKIITHKLALREVQLNMLSFLRFSEALIYLFCSLVYNGSMPIESGFSCDSGEGFTLLLPLTE